MNTNFIINQSGIIFGTSGTRGLVNDFSPDVCPAFSITYIKSIDTNFSFTTVALGIDSLPSSYRTAQ